MDRIYQVPCKIGRLDNHELANMFSEIPTTSSVVIYGAGNYGYMLNTWFEANGYSIECFCDMDFNKHNDLYCGKVIISPETLYQKYTNSLIVVSLYGLEMEIRDNLIAKGIKASNIILPPFKTVEDSINIPQDAMPQELKDAYPLAASRTPGYFTERISECPPVLVRTMVYNVKESYLRRAIESILNQTFTNFRYLIIDNGSTDGSSKIIQEYAEKDSRITVIRNERNLSTRLWQDDDNSRAQWEKIQRITSVSDYVCILDSDDYYMPDFIEATYSLAAQHNADIVTGRTIIYGEHNPGSTRESFSPQGVKVFDTKKSIIEALFDYLELIWGVPWCKLMKTEIYNNKLDKDRFADVGNMWDVASNIHRLSHAKKVIMTDKLLHCHTSRPGGMSKQLSLQLKSGTRMVAIYSYLEQLLTDSGLADDNLLSKRPLSYFFHLTKFELKMIAKAIDDNRPELVIQVINNFLQHPLPPKLRADPRTDALLNKLRGLLAVAKQQLDPEGAI